MFTGIVEEIGRVVSITERSAGGPGDGGRRIEIGAIEVVGDLRVGGSIAVDGACLTAVRVSRDRFTVDAVPETLARTTLGSLREGGRVNLERAMPASGRFEGHIVQGHVDGVGSVVSTTPEGEGVRLRIRPPTSVGPYVVEKGSVTVDGISLTVASEGDGRFDVALIPHTLQVTTIGDRAPGDEVNLEADILAKYVQQLTKR